MPEPLISAPWFPIIYVRGYAATQGEVDDAAASPYMGFNEGSTTLRQTWDRRVLRHVFESPLVRLMKDHGYRDVYDQGCELPAGARIPARSVIIHRYYDQAADIFGADGRRGTVEEYAQGLSRLIARVRQQVCGDDVAARAAFKVHLVAHSMGGLVCRCLLQNPNADVEGVRGLVDRFFTYATPHNGIDLALIGNLPGFLTYHEADTFNRERMAGYLNLRGPDGGTPERVDDLGGAFPPERCFCLVGTDDRDYEVAGGLARRAAGPFSDGLVRIANASLRGAARAFVHRSHSGRYGIVNSEEGYQNLQRFLFGDLRVEGRLRIDSLTLPPEVEQAKQAGRQVRASYLIEVVARPRGAAWALTSRTADQHAAIHRTYDEIFHPERAGLDDARHPHLFTAFLALRHRPPGAAALVMALDLRVRVPDYEIDGRLWDSHIAGSNLLHETLILELHPPADDDGAWGLRWGLDRESPGRATHDAEVVGGVDGGLSAVLPLDSGTTPGFTGALELSAAPWR